MRIMSRKGGEFVRKVVRSTIVNHKEEYIMKRRTKRKGRVLSVFLACCMLLSIVPSLTSVAEEVPVNLAQGKKVTANPAMGTMDEAALALVTNGKVEAGWDKSFCYHTGNEAENTEIKPWIQIDLEKSYDVDRIMYYGLIPPDYESGYKNEPRNLVIQLSNDEKFEDSSTVTVFNSDKKNFFGFGSGTDQDQLAEKEGRLISFEPVNARYVRYYQHGAKQSDHNEPGWVNALALCELEVFSKGEMTEPPEKPGIPEGNLAYQAKVTGASYNSTGASISDWWGGWNNNDLQQITDGSVDDNWKAPRTNEKGAEGHSTYLLVDLGKTKELNTVKIWNKSGMTYLTQIVQISADGKNWINVYNSDKENLAGQDPDDSGKTVCGGKLTNGVITGVKAGNDTSYKEGNGKTISFAREKARYIRWWSSGNLEGNDLPQMIQLQAYNYQMVTFDYQDGREPELATVTKGASVSRPSTPISATPGLLFDKWTVDKAGGVEWNFEDPVTEDLKLVANWKQVAVHTVTFDTDGGSEIEPVEVTDTLAVARPENPVKDGKVFAGWKLAGEPYDFGTPVTGDITLKATWVEPAVPDAFTIHAGLLDIVLDSHGQVTNLNSTIDGTDYATLGPDNKLRSLMSLVADYQIETPTSLTWNEESGELIFGFASIDTEAVITLKNQGDYTSLTLTDVKKPKGISLQAILWGPIKNTITTGGQTVGTAYDDSYAIGMHMLNTKTVGGWPIEFKEAFYAPDLPAVNGYPDSRVTRNIYSNTAAFSTWGSALNAYTWDYTEESMRTIAYFSEVPMRTPALTGYHADENASIIGSSIALYGTRTPNILNVINNIQLKEGLPHTTIDGEWQKTSEKTGQDFLVFNDAIWGLDVVENDAKMANAAGINYIYGQYGASGPWHGEGGYQFNGNFGGSDENVTQMVEKAGEYGVYIGTHTLSNLISSGNHKLYMGDGMTSGLSYSGFAELTRDVNAEDSEIYIADGHPFSPEVTNADGGTKWLRIGDEIMGFSECVQVGEKEWKVSITQRGAHSTSAAEHKSGENAYNLWSYYTTDFLGGWDAIKPMTDRMGYIYSDLGVHAMSYDSFESTKYGAYSSMMPAEYMKAVWNNVKKAGKEDGFITEASDMDTNVWDVHSRISWGESNTPIDAMMNYLGYYRQNFFPAMLGWMYDHGNHGGYSQSQLLMNLSMKGGWNAGAGWYVNRNTFNAYPYMAEMLKTWNNAIQCGAFTVGDAYTEELQSDMRNAWKNGRIWTLTETVANEEWVLQEVNKANVEEKIGEPVTLTATKDIEINQPENGDIATNVSLEYSRAHAGDVITVYTQSHIGNELKADSLTVTGESGTVYELLPSDEQKDTYTFIMPEENVSLTAEFGTEKPENPEKIEKMRNILRDTIEYAEKQSTDGVAESAVEYFTSVLKEAKDIVDVQDVTFEALHEAWLNLLDGIHGLGITTGDKSMLEYLINQAEDMKAEKDRYVEKNWPQLEDALREAYNILENGDALEEDIAPVQDALLEAILAQRYKANKDNLQDLVNKAEQLDTGKYTKESVAVFKEALKAATEILDDESLSEEDQDVVDKAEKKLSDAMDGLKLASGDGDDSNKDDGNQNDSNQNDGNKNDGNQGGSKNDGKDAPKTGDNAPIVIWSILGLCAVAAVVVIIIRKKR